LRKAILPGMQLGSVFFSDIGVEVKGHLLSELEPCFKKANFTVTLLNPTRPKPRKQIVLSKRLDIEVPPSVSELGMVLTKTKGGLKIGGINPRSPCWLGAQAKFLRGMKIKALLVDTYVFDELNTATGLATAIKDTKGHANRMLMLEQVAGGQDEELEVTKVQINRNNARLGIQYEGGKRQLRITSSTNPKLPVGKHIVGLVDSTGTEYEAMEDFELRELLETTKNQHPRYLLIREADWHDSILVTHADDEAAA